MARTFNRAYDQADRMLNTSGISSLPVVYKDVGGRLLGGIDKLEDIIFASNLPKDKKNELYNLLTGSKLREWETGRAVPNTSLNKAASDFLKDIVVSATAPPGTDVGIKKHIPIIGPLIQPTTDALRSGIRGLIQSPTIRNMLGNIDTGDYSKDIKALQSELKSNPDPDLAEELKDLIDIQKSQELKRKNPLSAQYALYLDQFLPDKVVDGKRYYNPVTEENKSKYFSEESQKGVGQELRQNLETKLKAREEGVYSGKTLKNIGDADLLYSEPQSLGKVYYGSYDSRGKWQEGIPNWDGTFTVKDEYNWNRDFPVGPGAIIRSLANYINPETRSLKSVAESIAGTVAPIGAQGEGRKIEFNVPAYSDPVKQLDVMRQLDRPPSVSPTGDLGRPPLDQPQQSDIVAEANKLGVPVIDVEQPGLPGMGWHHEAFNDPDDFTEQYTDYHTGLKHGGQTMSRGLSGINKSININGQPHSLAWINPGEASALRAMGGSGKPGPMGIPSYQDELYDYDDEYEIGTGGEFGVTSTPATPTGQTNFDEATDWYNESSSNIPDSGDTWQEERAEIIKSSGTGGGRGADPRAFTYYREPIEDKDPAGGVPYYGGSDSLTSEDVMKGRYSKKLNPYINALYDSGMISTQVADYMAGLSSATLAGMREAYDTGYSYGGPMGTMRGLSRDQGTDYAKKLKLKKLTGKETKKQKEQYLSDIKTRIEDAGGTWIKSAKFEGMYGDEWKEILKSQGYADPVTGELTTMGTAMDWAKPFSMVSKAGAMGLNALTSAFGVLGEFITPEGKSFRVMDDGTLVEPDIYADTDEGNIERQPISRLPPPIPQPAPLEPELTGIAALQAERPEVASIGTSLQPQFNNIVISLGGDTPENRKTAAQYLNKPVNIFAEVG